MANIEDLAAIRQIDPETGENSPSFHSPATQGQSTQPSPKLSFPWSRKLQSLIASKRRRADITATPILCDEDKPLKLSDFPKPKSLQTRIRQEFHCLDQRRPCGSPNIALVIHEAAAAMSRSRFGIVQRARCEPTKNYFNVVSLIGYSLRPRRLHHLRARAE